MKNPMIPTCVNRVAHKGGGDAPEFDASVRGCEVPIGLGVVGIAVLLPGGDLLSEDLLIGYAAIEALGR
jgi:hypothetical protein